MILLKRQTIFTGCDKIMNDAFENYKLWHKQNQSQEQTDKVKEFLKDGNPPIPILHNQKEIILQYSGWCISLLDDGTWYWEDTTGG